MTTVENMLTDYKSSNGITLQDHIVQLIQKFKEKENASINDLEIISNYIKQNTFNFKGQQTDKQLKLLKAVVAKNNQYIQQSKDLIQIKNQTNYQKFLFPDLQQDYYLFEQAGISFGKEETFRLQCSIQKLIIQEKPLELRFWGKILTQNRDYYVLEGVSQNNELADKLGPDVEPKGQGINMFTYWVCQDLLQEWQELPLISPLQLNLARQIKYIFTGNLNKQVTSYPFFNGKEKHILKAQIVRISSNSVVYPNSLYKFNEENKEGEQNILFEDSYKYPEYNELKELDKWVHKYCHILKQGRVTHYVPDHLNEEEKSESKSKQEEEDPDTIKRLQPITEDKGPYFKEGEENPDIITNWKVKEIGDSQTYKNLDETNSCYGTIVIKNQTWPGAHIIANQKGYTNVYIGYALKQNQYPFLPLQPNDIQEEEQENNEFREPNPKDPIKEYKPEEEKKEGEEEGEQQEEQ